VGGRLGTNVFRCGLVIASPRRNGNDNTTEKLVTYLVISFAIIALLL
jgi:hypothetical protein